MLGLELSLDGMQGVRALHVLLCKLLDRLNMVLVVVAIRCDIFVDVGAFASLCICTIIIYWHFLLVGIDAFGTCERWGGRAGRAGLRGVGVVEVEHVSSVFARRPAHSLLPRPP